MNTIFKDLATMVHEQGGMVDSIEQNVESTNIRVHEGTDQLTRNFLFPCPRPNSAVSSAELFNVFSASGDSRV